MLAIPVNKIYALFLSDTRRKQFERFIFLVAIVLFIIHFTLIVVSGGGMNPISAIYTPFSIILLYEIYLLIYYLPMSITIYLGKQYEIITLILIRKIFDDLSTIPIGSEPFEYTVVNELLLTFGGLLVLCLLIFVFYRLSGKRTTDSDEDKCVDAERRRFVIIKKIMSLGLLALFLFLFGVTLFELRDLKELLYMEHVVSVIYQLNTAFFDTFFTALIITEVLLLLFTFNLSDEFSKVVRNSGFIISTILLKLSFKAVGLANIGIILVAVAFGVSVLAIHQLFSRKLS